ncbi:MAG: hypothetical protein RQ722_01855 [Desulfuromonadales bacterium]|nr:hypothetical protein [Desulfuromonadales bacterium]
MKGKNLAGLFVDFFERHALKDQALQPKPELLGATQLVLEACAETTFAASCLQSGQVIVSFCVLESFSNVWSHNSQWYSNKGITHLTGLFLSNIFKLYDLFK